MAEIKGSYIRVSLILQGQALLGDLRQRQITDSNWVHMVPGACGQLGQTKGQLGQQGLPFYRVRGRGLENAGSVEGNCLFPEEKYYHVPRQEPLPAR